MPQLRCTLHTSRSSAHGDACISFAVVTPPLLISLMFSQSPWLPTYKATSQPFQCPASDQNAWRQPFNFIATALTRMCLMVPR